MLLLLKLLLVPGLVAAVTLAVRRWGPAVGGWLAALPVVAGPVLVFYALEQGNAFAARAAHATLTGLIATVAFVVAYARCSIRLPWYPSVAVGWAAFAGTVLLLYGLQTALVTGLVPSLVSVIAATVLARRALPWFAAGRNRLRQGRDASRPDEPALTGRSAEASRGGGRPALRC